jgi:hypothetical protein
VHVHGHLVPGVYLCLRSYGRGVFLGTVLNLQNQPNEGQHASGDQTANNDPGVTGELIWIEGWQRGKSKADEEAS